MCAHVQTHVTVRTHAADRLLLAPAKVKSESSFFTRTLNHICQTGQNFFSQLQV